MSVFSEDVLAARFAALAPTPLQGDWLDVQHRAQRRRHGRRALALAIAAALAVLLIGSALGGRRVLDYFGADPAADRVVLQFETSRRSVRAHWGTAWPAVGRDLRTVFEVRFADGLRASIALAPTDAGFCSVVDTGAQEAFAVGCDDPEQPRSGPITFLTPTPDLGYDQAREMLGSHDFIGAVTDPETAHLVLRYEDGREDDVPLTWVSEPIDAGFFAFDPTPEHYGKGRRASAFVALDAKNHEIGRASFDYGRPHRDPWSFPTGSGMPRAIDPSTVHRLETPHLPPWMTVVAGRSGTGGVCFRVAYDLAAGCRRPGTTFECCAAENTSYGQRIAGRARPVAVLAGFMAADAKLELTFEDGRMIVVRPQDNVLVYAIPPERFRPGRRLVGRLIRKDDTGRVVKRWVPQGPVVEPHRVGDALLVEAHR